MNYTATVRIPAKKIERVNRLLAVPSLKELSDEEILALGANTQDWEEIYLVSFEDGSALNFTLCSDVDDYHGEPVWENANGEIIFFDWVYILESDEFEINGNKYSVKIEAVEEGN